MSSGVKSKAMRRKLAARKAEEDGALTAFHEPEAPAQHEEVQPQGIFQGEQPQSLGSSMMHYVFAGLAVGLGFALVRLVLGQEGARGLGDEVRLEPSFPNR
jgi:hypothetical protein